MALREPTQPKHDTVMDVTEEQIARVYAKAFLGVAANTARSAELVDELESVVDDVLNPFPKFEELFRSELVSQEQKESLIEKVLGKRASTEVLNFLKVVARHRRLGLLRPIARQVKKLHAEGLGLANVEVRVPVELDDALRDEIQAALRKLLRSTPVLNVVIDPSLIAGFVLRSGDRVYDASVKTHFESLRRAMIERATERIEIDPGQFLRADR